VRHNGYHRTSAQLGRRVVTHPVIKKRAKAVQAKAVTRRRT
jgi:hypothetical protein